MARTFGTNLRLNYGSAILTDYPFTISAWANPANITANHTIAGLFQIDGVSGNTDAFYLSFAGASGGDPVQAIAAVSNTFRVASTSSGFSSGVWQHGCGVFSSATSRTVYLNGGNSGTNTTSTTPATPTDTLIGAYNSGNGYFYSDVSVAEVAFWNVALSAEEVAALARGVSPVLIRPAALVSYAPVFGRGSPEPDLIAGSWTLTGSPAYADHPLTSRGGAIIIPFPAATGGDHNLLADDLSTTPTLTEPSIGQTHVLAADDVTTTATLTEPALGQVHALLADDLATTPTLTEPSVGQVHALTANDISTTPTLSEPVLAIDGTDALTADDLSIAPTLTAATLGQVHVLLAGDITVTPTLGQPALGEPVTDEYAAQGWATRDFYSPYWMGMADPREVERVARERAQQSRKDYGPVPSEAEDIIARVAREQAEEDGDEIEQFIALNEAITEARQQWQDHYGGHLKALRDELREANEARARVQAKRATAAKTERARLEAQARDELEQRRLQVALAKRNRNIMTTLLLLSAA